MNRYRNSLRLPMAALLLGLAAALPARADDARDHDRARQALEQGEILPLRTILESVERDTPGQIMEVELDRDEGRWIYEIKVLRTGGSLVKLSIDARSGTVLGSRERAAKGAPRAGEKR